MVNGKTITFGYDPLGQRVSKTSDGKTTRFAYDSEGHLIGEYDADGKARQEIVWLGDLPVALFTYEAGKLKDSFAIHTDHLGTPRELTRQGNTVVWRWEGEPFGNSLPNEDVDGDGQKVSFNLRFPGQYHDSETGRFYNYFRDYNPATGRYVQSDPIGLAGGG
ncbi:RHS repeat domain-containing protein [Parachitinimonas caeni]|uniref:RHS repeat domain-containing protein n=1 Tax=Parachitinimonas caeni TaxID=3031301 RepID=UPI0038B2B182